MKGMTSLPSWERGLKSQSPSLLTNPTTVAPLVGAWIEILVILYTHFGKIVAPLVGAWIEISKRFINTAVASVAPLVGAWIEI